MLWPQYPNGSKVLYQNKIWTVIRKEPYYNDIYLKDNSNNFERWYNYDWEEKPIPIKNYKRISIPTIETFEIDYSEGEYKYLRCGNFEVKHGITRFLLEQLRYKQEALDLRDEDLLRELVRAVLKEKL